MGEKKILFLPNQRINIMYPNKVNMIAVPINQKNRDHYEYPSLSHLMVGRKVFHANPKDQYHLSQCGEHDCSAQSQKEWRLL